jgi:hypothetical protein
MADLHNMQRFWSIIEYNAEHNSLFEDVIVPIAADDRDLMAFYEIKKLGYTDRVGEKRAAILEDYNYWLLRLEVRDCYGLPDEHMGMVEELCLKSVSEQLHSAD